MHINDSTHIFVLIKFNNKFVKRVLRISYLKKRLYKISINSRCFSNFKTFIKFKFLHEIG